MGQLRGPSQRWSAALSVGKAGARRKHALEVLGTLLLGSWVAVLHFRPAWRSMVDEGTGILDGLGDVFLTTTNPEPLFGHTADLMGTIWTFDALRGMLEGRIEVVNTRVFAPVGMDSGAAQGFAWLDALLAQPLVSWLDPVGFYNLYVAMLIVANVAVLVLLLRRVGAPFALAAGLAVLVCFSPFARIELSSGRTTQAHWIFHCLFLLFVVQLLSPRGRWLRDGVLAGLSLAAACFVYWFSAIAVGLVGALACLASLVTTRQSRRRILLRGGLLSVIALIAVIAPTWRLSSQVLSPGAEAGWMNTGSARVVSFFGLFDFTTQAAGIADLGGWGSLVDALTTHSLPLALLCAGAIALCSPWGWRRSLPWALAWLLLLTMPLGAAIAVGEQSIATPLAIAERGLPVLGRLTQPERLVVAPMLGLAIAVASAGAALVHRFRPWSRWAVWGTLPLLCWLATLPTVEPSLAAYRIQPESIYVEAARRWPGAIIDVPLRISTVRYTQQLFHGRAVLGGPDFQGTWTRSEVHRRYCEGNSVLVWLERTPVEPMPAIDFDAMDLERLVDDGFGIVVVRLNGMETPGWWFSKAFATPFIRVNDSVAFPLLAPDRLEGRLTMEGALASQAGWALDEKTARNIELRSSAGRGWLAPVKDGRQEAAGLRGGQAREAVGPGRKRRREHSERSHRDAR